MNYTFKIILIALIGLSVNACSPVNMADEGMFKDSTDLKKRISKGEDVNFQDKDGCTALINAATYGNLDSLKILLEAGADVNLRNNEGETAIGTVAYSSESTDGEMIDLLISKGANINTKNNYGETSLFYAVAYGYKDLVETLLSRGASVSVKNNEGETPIWEVCSASENNKEILDILLSKGANINSRDNENDTISALTSCKNKKDLMTYMKLKGLN